MCNKMTDEEKSTVTDTDSVDSGEQSGAAAGSEGGARPESKKVAEFRARMAERSESARKSAEEELARREYEDEYRRRFSAKGGKRAAEEKERREREESERARARMEEREREIEEFKRREREEAEARASHTAELFDAVSAGGIRIPETAEAPEAAEEMPSPVLEHAPSAPEPESETDPETESDTADTSHSIHIRASVIASRESSDAPSPISSAPTKTEMPATPVAPPPIMPTREVPPQPTHPYAPPIPTPIHTPIRTPAQGPIPTPITVSTYPPSETPEEAERRRVLEAERRAAREAYETERRKLRAEEISVLEDEKRRYSEDAERLRRERERLAAARAAAAVPAEGPVETRGGTANAASAKGADPAPRTAGDAVGIGVPTYTVGISGRRTPTPPPRDEYIPESSPEPSYSDVRISVDASAPAAEDASVTETVPETRPMKTGELYKRLAKLHKDEDALAVKREKVGKKYKKATLPENVKLAIEMHSISAQIVEISEEELLICVKAENKKETAKHIRFLNVRVSNYNEDTDLLSSLTGQQLSRLDPRLADVIIESGRVVPVPTVRYEESMSTDDPYGGYDIADDVPDLYVPVASAADEELLTAKDKRRDKREEREEQLRLIREEREETERRRREARGEMEAERSAEDEKRREALKAHSDELARIKEEMARDIAMINARSEYIIAGITEKKNIAEHSFTTDYISVRRSKRSYERDIAEERSIQKRAVKCERAQNEIYYKIFMSAPATLKAHKPKTADRVRAIRAKIEFLLARRDMLNVRLTELYGGAGSDSTSDVSDKMKSLKRKRARGIYNQQKGLAKRISKLAISDDLKKKIFDLMNKKTEIVANIEAAKYKLKRSRSKAVKRQLKRDIKSKTASLKSVDEQIKYCVKQAERQDKTSAANREWIGFLIAAVVIAGIIALLYFTAGDTIIEFCKTKLAELFGGK